jgi:hypothetical protein
MQYPNDDGPIPQRDSRPIGYVSAYTPSFRQRLLWRLFPTRSVPIPEDTDGFAPSYIMTRVISNLDWKDRLRVLLSGRLAVETQTKTDVVVSKMVSQSVVYVLPPNSGGTEL